MAAGDCLAGFHGAFLSCLGHLGAALHGRTSQLASAFLSFFDSTNATNAGCLIYIMSFKLGTVPLISIPPASSFTASLSPSSCCASFRLRKIKGGASLPLYRVAVPQAFCCGGTQSHWRYTHVASVQQTLKQHVFAVFIPW